MIINQLMRDVLIEHIDGSASISVEIDRSKPHFRTTAALIVRGFIRTDGSLRPRRTFITAAGRSALARALADWADAIVRSRLRRMDKKGTIEIIDAEGITASDRPSIYLELMPR